MWDRMLPRLLKIYTKSRSLNALFCRCVELSDLSLSRSLLTTSSINSLHSCPIVQTIIPSINTKRFCSSEKRIYTKTGDKGYTSLYTGERRSKSDNIFYVLGNIDELSSFIGSAKENALEKTHDYVEQLERIQCILQDIGTLIATPLQLKNIKNEERKEKLQKRIRFSKRHILELEGWIDQHTETLPPLSNFLLPGGGKVSASLHICRTVCRRVERSVVPFVVEEVVDENVLVYLNRLSDYLFTVARHATLLDGKKETIYIRPKPNKEYEKDDKEEEKARGKG